MTEPVNVENDPNPGMQMLVNHLLQEVSNLSMRAILAESNLELVTAERDRLAGPVGMSSQAVGETA